MKFSCAKFRESVFIPAIGDRLSVACDEATISLGPEGHLLIRAHAQGSEPAHRSVDVWPVTVVYAWPIEDAPPLAALTTAATAALKSKGSK